MNSAPSTARCSVADVSSLRRNGSFGSVSSASKIHITLGDIGNLGRPSEMRKVLNRKVVEQGGKCGICHEAFTDCNEVVSDHIEPG